jgi:hypothetical protein
MITCTYLLPRLNCFFKEKSYKSPGINKILAELIQTGDNTLRSDILKRINSTWDKEEVPQKWIESTIVPIYRNGDKTCCSNYRGISLLPTTHKIVSNIFISSLNSYIEGIIGDNRCEFRHNRLTTHQVFWIRQILEKKWELMGKYISYL